MINAKSIMGMMTLDLPVGEQVVVTADGVDEEKAVNDIEKYFKQQLRSMSVYSDITGLPPFGVTVLLQLMIKITEETDGIYTLACPYRVQSFGRIQ